jgi:purine-binding chemotaxis protein CheW
VNGNTTTDQLAALRHSFDEAFAVLPPQLREEGLEQLLLIRVAGEALALKTLHVTGLARIGRILPIPSRIPELLGITGIRGTLAPVFDLAALLGFHPGGAQPRWLALTCGETQIALAFDQIEGQIAVSRTSLYEHQASSAREHIKEVARIEHAVHAVADIPAIVEAIRRRAGLINSNKE